MTESWMPSVGREYEWFDFHWCARCIHDKALREALEADEPPPDDGCDILAFALSGEEVSEWVTDENGPRCTAFELHPDCAVDDVTDDMFSEPR